MRHPLWILNSALLALFLLTVGFVFVSRQGTPEREDIEPAPITKSTHREGSRINISKIYEDDLFGTYQREVSTEPGFAPVTPLPEPPAPVAVSVPQEPKPEFLDPLPITLRGIIMVLDDDSKSRGIVADNRTNQETAYKVGDKIEDAQLVRIFSNKVLFIRSNGQLEVLYLREKDAKLDPAYAHTDSWTGVIQEKGVNEFSISASQFYQRVPSLAQFIDMLDITTVYRQGKSIGVRIGQVNPKIFATAMGLSTGDIITTINGKLLDSAQGRMQVYQQIISQPEGSTVSVDLLRNNRPAQLRYTIEDIKPVRRIDQPGQKLQEPSLEQVKLFKQSHQLAPTVQELRSNEQKLMLDKGRRPPHIGQPIKP